MTSNNRVVFVKYPKQNYVPSAVLLNNYAKILVLIFAFTFIFICNNSFAQTDSIRSVILKAKTDYDKLIVIKNLSETSESKDSTNAFMIAREIEIATKNITGKTIAAECYRIAGNIYAKRSSFEKSFHLLNKAYELVKTSEINDDKLILANVLHDLGFIYFSNGDFQSALSNYLDAEQLFWSLENTSGLIKTYSKLGDLYDKLNQADKRIFYNNKAFELVPKTNDQSAVAQAYTGIATNYITSGDFDKAREYYIHAKNIAIKIKDKRLESTAAYDIGFSFSKQENYTEAFDWYNKSYELNLEIGDRFGMSDALYKMGLVKYYSGKYEESEVLLSKAMEIANSINSDILRRNIYDVFYSLEESKGNYKKAYEYLNKYIDVVYLIFDEDGQKQINFLNARYQSVKKEFEIQKLESEQKIHLLNLERQKSMIIILIICLILIAAITLIVLRNIQYKRRIEQQKIKIQEQKIKEFDNERRLFAAQAVLEGEEAERKRLARDLHDGLGGMLSVVKLKLLNMKGNLILNSEDVPVFQNALEMLDNSIKELRQVAHNLMPESLLRYGLKAALTDFCGGIEKVNLHYFGEDRRQEEKYEIALFRIIQELVNNAIKHSNAQQINVQLIVENERINLVVQDNGTGFDISIIDGSKTNGLSNIKSRVESLNGNLEFITGKGKGTEVQIDFKL